MSIGVPFCASCLACQPSQLGPKYRRDVEDPQSFDRFAADYDRFTTLARPVHMDWVTRSLPQHGRRALDVGCGSGRFTVILAQRFEQVVGIDISQRLIEIARCKRPRQNIDYRVADLTQFEDSSGFDLIFSSTTLHHVPEVSTALTRLRTMLRPGGLMMLIDNVAPRPSVPRWRHAAGALRRFPFDVLRLGPRSASSVLSFQIGRPWLEHMASDRYLSPAEFERVYGAAFPGGRFAKLGYLHALVWNNDGGTPHD